MAYLFIFLLGLSIVFIVISFKEKSYPDVVLFALILLMSVSWLVSSPWITTIVALFSFCYSCIIYHHWRNHISKTKFYDAVKDEI